MTVSDIQTIDFEGFSDLIGQKKYQDDIVQNVIHQLREASSEQGFFYLKNHGINQEDIDEIFTMLKKYFDQPVETKTKDFILNGAGYARVGQEKFSNDLQDSKEMYSFRTNWNDGELPDILGRNRDKIDGILKKTWSLTSCIMTGLALSLGVEPDYFNKAHTNKERSETTLRLLHYPPVNDSVDREKTIRAGSHSDFGTITFLFHQTSSDEQLESSTGLQILQMDSSGNEVWTEVPAQCGTIIVNIADLLSLWTEGRFRSAVHRVVIPDGDAARRSRYAFAHFITPDANYKIYPAPTQLSVPHPAIEVEPGKQKASFGVTDFYYGETGEIYVRRRVDETNY